MILFDDEIYLLAANLRFQSCITLQEILLKVKKLKTIEIKGSKFQMKFGLDRQLINLPNKTEKFCCESQGK